jgi:hypothetical protein
MLRKDYDHSFYVPANNDNRKTSTRENVPAHEFVSGFAVRFGNLQIGT